MGIFSRMTDIVQSNVNNLLDRAEDPAKLVRQMILEMEDTLIEVRSGTVSLLADQKNLERQYQQLSAQAEDWGQKAALAVKKARDDLAKQALLAKKEAESRLADLQQQLKTLTETVAQHNADVQRLEAKLQETKAREKLLMARSQSADGRIQANHFTHSSRVDEVLHLFEETEMMIDRAETFADHTAKQQRTLNEEFIALEQEEYLKTELAKLKQEINDLKAEQQDNKQG